ncbi:hypothetical protein niasHT_015745 [Heterodera trifolii]|uniref:Uncharacterized protein n=1 Tax=Heterodera trifolii TaxID=157864 RepID=A0ABD2L5E5_9BILA
MFALLRGVLLFALLLAMRMFAFLVNCQQQQQQQPHFSSSSPSSVLLAASSPPSVSFVRSPCALFVYCEHAKLRIHRRCTERSRKAITERCGLSAEFEELFRLSERRFDQFGECVTNEVGQNNGEAECSESEVSSIGVPTTPSPNIGCWRSLAGLREQCQRLQQCCKTATGCMANVSTSEATMALRAQHIEINRKTLQCRQTQHPLGPTNSAGVDSSPLSETDILSPGDIGPLPVGPPAPPVSARVHSVPTASLLPRVLITKTHAKKQLVGKNGRSIAFFGQKTEKRTPRKLTRRLSQFMADHRPVGIFSSAKTKSEHKTDAIPLHLTTQKQQRMINWTNRTKLSRLRLYSARTQIGHKGNAAENDWIFWQKKPRQRIRILPTSPSPLPIAPFSAPFPPSATVSLLSSTTTVSPVLSTIDSSQQTKTKEKMKTPMKIVKIGRKKSLRLFNLSARPKKVFRTSVLRMIAHRQPEGFALPSRLDFHRMRLYAARPKLSHSFALAARRRARFWHLRGRTDAFGRGKKQTDGAKAAEKDRIGLSQIEAELSLSLPLSSSVSTTPLPLAPSPSLSPLTMPSSTPPAAMFPQIWTKPYPRGPNAWGELEAQLSTPQAITQTIDTTTEEGEWHRKSSKQKPMEEGENGTVVDSEAKVTSKSEKIAETTETKVKFKMERKAKGDKKGEEKHTEKIDTTSATRTTTETAPTAVATTETPTQRFGGKSRSSGRVRSRVYGVVPKHAGETRRERPKMEAEQGKLAEELAGTKSVGRPSLHSSSSVLNSLGYREKVFFMANQMKLRSDSLPNFGKKSLLPSSIRRSPTKGMAKIRPLSPLKRPPPQLLTLFPSGIKEMERIRELLVRQLEKQQRRVDPSPLPSSPPSSNHCQLFISCMFLLRSVQSDLCRPSPAETGRPVPGPPRRRFGRCNARLLPLFERVDSARAELEHGAEQCLEEKVREGTTRTKGSCPKELSVLPSPTMNDHLQCSERIALLHRHCTKLGRCCESLESCQNRIGTSGLTRRVRLEEQKLALRSMQCQKQAHEMFRIFREKQRIDEELLRAKRRRKMMKVLFKKK